MSAPEGIRRIAAAIKWLGYGLGGVVALFFMVVFVMDGSILWGLAIALVLGALIAGVGHLLSWVVYGFSEPKEPGG